MNNTDYINKAAQAWGAAQARRQQRLRHLRYTYGNQWGDTVTDPHGRTITEEQAIIRSGHNPMTNNLIRRLVKTIVGYHRTLPQVEKAYNALPPLVTALNMLPELDARAMEEFLISGCAIQRIVRENRPAGSGVWVDNIAPDRVFTNAFTDPRALDLSLIGCIHTMAPQQVVARFAGGSRQRALQLKQALALAAQMPQTGLGDLPPEFFAAPRGMCNVIELWTLDPCEQRFALGPRQGHERPDLWRLDFRWTCRWMAPDGALLAQYASPYAHRQHPFAIKFYPLTDGQVHPFVGDLIDQQHYINRVTTLIDRMLGTAAKGVLLFPMSQLMPDWDYDRVLEEWSRPDGVIPISDESNLLPQQISSPQADSGAYRLLQLQLELFNKTAGVSEALMGNADSAATGQGRFQQQLAASQASLADIFRSFSTFLEQRNQKILAL